MKRLEALQELDQARRKLAGVEMWLNEQPEPAPFGCSGRAGLPEHPEIFWRDEKQECPVCARAGAREMMLCCANGHPKVEWPELRAPLCPVCAVKMGEKPLVQKIAEQEKEIAALKKIAADNDKEMVRLVSECRLLKTHFDWAREGWRKAAVALDELRRREAEREGENKCR